MLSVRCWNSQKSENTNTSVVNSNFFLEIFWKHDKSLQSLGVHDSSAFYQYHFIIFCSHFSSDILVPSPDSSNLYSGHNNTFCAKTTNGSFHGRPSYGIQVKNFKFHQIFIHHWFNSLKRENIGYLKV